MHCVTHIHGERLQCYAGAATNPAVHTLATTIMRGELKHVMRCNSLRKNIYISNGAKCDSNNYDVKNTKWMDEKHELSTYTYLRSSRFRPALLA